MKTCLVVLDQPVVAQSMRFGLLDLVSRRKPVQFVLLQTTRRVPSETSEESRQVAYARVLNIRSQLMAMGIPIIDAVAGDSLPRKAIADELAAGRRSYDGILLATKPTGIQRLIHCDPARQLERKFHVPVSYVDFVISQELVTTGEVRSARG